MLHVVAPDPGDESDIMLEVNAGAGGLEAMLFTDEIFQMYMGYAEYKGWSVENVNSDPSPLGRTISVTLELLFSTSGFYSDDAIAIRKYLGGNTGCGYYC